MIRFSENIENTPQILAIGIGGAGCSVIEKISGVSTFLIDTDQTTVNSSTAKEKICITNRLNSQELARELKPFVSSLPKAEIVFTVSGLGGNTGTAITPVLVQLLKERAFWVWSLITLPFFFEGKPKILNSLKGLKSVQQSANAFLVIPHDKIFKMVDKTLSMKEAFTPANNLCAEIVLSIDRLTRNDWVNPVRGGASNGINIKFSDIKERMLNKHSTSFGIGEGFGSSRLQMAIEQAISSPLLGKELLGSAESLIVGIQGGEAITLDEVNLGIEYLRGAISKDIIFGVAIDPVLKDNAKVGIITTGIDADSNVDNWDISLSTLVKRTSALNRPLQRAQKPQQTMIDFKRLQKGRFEKSEATMYGGEDLDVPTFLRKKK